MLALQGQRLCHLLPGEAGVSHGGVLGTSLGAARRGTKPGSWGHPTAAPGTAAQLSANSWNLSSGFYTPPEKPWQSVPGVFSLYNSLFTG